MTLKLCGFSASNYYNQVKLQLLEKQLDFEEEMVRSGSVEPALLARSPMGKVPFLDTPHGCISESMACAEYIEAAYPQFPLLPADPFAAAKVRELLVYLELHLELVARELYAEAFFGGKVGDETKERVRKLLLRGAAGFGPGLGEGDGFGVEGMGVDVMAAAEDEAVFDDDGSDGGVRGGAAEAETRLFERQFEAIHDVNRRERRYRFRR